MKTIFTLALLAFSLTVFGQQTQGTIEYQETMKIKMNLPEGIKIDKEIPNTRTSNKILYFNATESIYLNGKKQEKNEHNFSSGNASVVIKMDEPENQYYKNIEEDAKIQKQDFFGKTFLIGDQLKNYAWKLTGKQKKILDYVCQEATYTSEEDTVSAWFAPQIPVSNGPAGYGKLPGMILEISKNSEQVVITATKISDTLPEDKLVAPKKGKKVNQEAFDKIKEEKMAEMKKMYGGSGNMIMIKEVRN